VGKGTIPKPIEAERLVLVACRLEVASALVAGDRAVVERSLDARLPAGWPDAELLEFLPLYSTYLRERPHALGYGVWLLVESGTRTVVGSSGFRGLPDADGELEIGYGIHPDYRNRGYATEAVRALVAWGLSQPGVALVRAHCDPANAPSARVAAKAGLIEDGETGGLMRWVATRG
jgi:ribosomal-protein-alanine N-acetyltransferase